MCCISEMASRMAVLTGRSAERRSQVSQLYNNQDRRMLITTVDARVTIDKGNVLVYSFVIPMLSRSDSNRTTLFSVD